jgi:sulfopyruvate decarboxylase alpha subunit
MDGIAEFEFRETFHRARLRAGRGRNGVDSTNEPAWPGEIFGILERYDVRQVAYVPDGGHAALIRMVEASPGMRAIALSTEEEGVALAAGAWMGGQRCALLMQSSGVGNCVNMLSLVRGAGFPLLTLVTMRGEWGEFNPWQIAMSSATAQSFEMMGVRTVRVERPEDVAPTVAAAASMVYEGDAAMAVLLAQRLIGAKVFVK